MVWVARPNDGQIEPAPLSDLDITQEELFGSVLEGTCPGCRGRLVIHEVKPDSQTYSDRCGWCELCLWGWSATIYRATDENHVWRDGEKLVTCYTQGALATAEWVDVTDRVIGEPTITPGSA